MGLTLLVVIVLANVVGSISLRVSGIPFAMVTLAFAQAGSVIVGRNPDGTTGGDEGLTLRTDNLPDFLVGVVNTRNLYWLALAVARCRVHHGHVGAVLPRRARRRGGPRERTPGPGARACSRTW